MLVDVKSYNKKSTSNNNNSKNERKNGLEAVPNWISIDVPVAQRTKEGIACWMCVHTVCTQYVQTSQNKWDKTYQMYVCCCDISLYGIVCAAYCKREKFEKDANIQVGQLIPFDKTGRSCAFA